MSADWNNNVRISASCSLFQTTFWADYLESLWNCKRIELPLKTGQLLLFGIDPHSYRLSTKRSILESLLRSRWYQWFGLPIPTSVALDYSNLFMSLHQAKGDIGRIMPSPLPVEAGPYVPKNWKIESWNTLVVNLQHSEADLWHGLKKTGRKAVRYAQQKGVEVRILKDREQTLEYCHIIAGWARERYGKNILEKNFMLQWDMLHEVDDCIFETFVASVGDNEIIAGLSIWGYNGYVAELGSFQSERNAKEHLFAQDLLKWEIIKYFNEIECKEYDLAGVNYSTDKETQISRFKEKWGGQIRPYLVVSKR